MKFYISKRTAQGVMYSAAWMRPGSPVRLHLTCVLYPILSRAKRCCIPSYFMLEYCMLYSLLSNAQGCCFSILSCAGVLTCILYLILSHAKGGCFPSYLLLEYCILYPIVSQAKGGCITSYLLLEYCTVCYILSYLILSRCFIPFSLHLECDVSPARMHQHQLQSTPDFSSDFLCCWAVWLQHFTDKSILNLYLKRYVNRAQ